MGVDIVCGYWYTLILETLLYGIFIIVLMADLSITAGGFSSRENDKA